MYTLKNLQSNAKLHIFRGKYKLAVRLEDQ